MIFFAIKLLILWAISVCAVGHELNKEPKLSRERRAIGVRSKENLWPDKTLYYKFDTNHEGVRKGIKMIFKELKEKTCLKFKEADSSTPFYVSITQKDSSACTYLTGYHRNSKYGRFYAMNYKAGCYNLGIMRKTLMYTLGFYNMMQAPDRDNYVKVLSENINPFNEDNFKKISSNQVKYYGVFDFASVTQYHTHYFARNPKKPTIQVKASGKKKFIDPFTNPEFSFYDLYSINKAYECNTQCTGTCPADKGFFDSNCTCVKSTDAIFAKWPPSKQAMSPKEQHALLVGVKVGTVPVKDITSDMTQKTGVKIYKVTDDNFLIVLNQNQMPADVFMGDEYLNPKVFAPRLRMRPNVYTYIDKHMRGWHISVGTDFVPESFKK